MGGLVRNASPHRGPWPRVSVWHGNADKTVIPPNALEILKQWTEVHGLPLSPSVKTRVDGFPREVWINEAGDELIEAYTITNMAHGTPLAIGEAEGRAALPDRFCCQWEFLHPITLQSFSGSRLLALPLKETW